MGMKYSLEHYYGDIARYLFLTAAVLMVIGLPLFQNFIQFPTLVSVIAITILVIAAGLTNPQQLTSATANFIISIIGFITFAYHAVTAVNNTVADDKYLLTNVLLAIIFLFALYFSMKTLRAKMLDPN